LLIGAPGIGKTAFAKQLVDQVAMKNNAAGVFFSFADWQQELRIKTVARLSSMDSREIRRGSAYLLHWYGVPRLRGGAPGEMSPSWEKLRLAAEQARSWLDSIYLIECGAETTTDAIATKIDAIRKIKNRDKLMVVIDDCQRLGERTAAVDTRLPMVVEQLQALAKNANLPMLVVWPDLTGESEPAPHVWAEKVASADVIMVMEKDAARSRQLTEPNQAITLHVVKNRGGERGKLAFEFQPAFANFVEVAHISGG
jgi:replicative DNA helicase